MARGVNKVFLIGNLGRDPETRYTQNGTAVTNINLATDESYKDRQSGQLVPKTEWHRIVMFGKLAEIAGQYLRKGSKAYFEGKLQTRKWQDQSGADRYSTEIAIDINGQMQMLDSPGSQGQPTTNVPNQTGGAHHTPASSQPAPQPGPIDVSGYGGDIDDQNIPF